MTGMGNMDCNYQSGNTATTGIYSASPINQGWICPKCGSAHAPTVQTCPQGWGLNSPVSAPFAQPYTVTCGQGTSGLQQQLQNVHPLASQGYNGGSISNAK